MLDAGVYLPPSAFEAWFVSAAHDDRAVSTGARRPAGRGRAAAAAARGDRSMSSETTVHLLRHGEVHNPEGVLYGRLPGFHLSELGRRWPSGSARRRRSRHRAPRTSPLERAQETAAPLAAARGLDAVIDQRVIEAANMFEGRASASARRPSLKRPRLLAPPVQPVQAVLGRAVRRDRGRMMAAVHDARDAARGHEAVIVSHQLPIWTTRLLVEKRSLLHDPRKRQCTLCSLTSLTSTATG